MERFELLFRQVGIDVDPVDFCATFVHWLGAGTLRVFERAKQARNRHERDLACAAREILGLVELEIWSTRL